MALSYVRCRSLRRTFAATAPRSTFAELSVVRRRYAHPPNEQMSNVLQALKLIGGLLFLIAPFTARFRRESPLWVQIAVPFSGALTEIHVALTYYLNGLRAAHDPQYWRVLGPRNFLGGIVVGILLSFLLHYVCGRISKTRNA